MNMKCYHRVLLCCFVAWFYSAVVECHGYLLDADGNALKEGNLADEDRPEDGVIKPTNIREVLFVKSNSGIILNDTGDEDAFKIPDERCKIDFPKCTATGGNCNAKVEEESKKPAVQCECPDKSVYEANEGCTVLDEVCKTDFPKCMETGGKCNVEVGNEKDQSVVHCECPEQKGYNEGVGCKACDCGINATGCRFVGDFKTCMCLPNYTQKDGKCVDCNCGKNSSGCKFNKYDTKICKCNESFFQRGKECVECRCGPKSFSCKFVKDEKECDCYFDYSQKDGVCTECGCGYYSYRCKYEKGEKICDCVSGYGQKDGVCIRQNRTESGLPASAIAPIVVGILVVIRLLAAVHPYCLKHSNKSQFQRNINDHRINSENTLNKSRSANREI